MTHQSMLWDINELAEAAAIASLDAHGDLVPAREAWDFLRQVCEDTEGEVYGKMNRMIEGMPRQFKHDYARHGRILSAGTHATA